MEPYEKNIIPQIEAIYGNFTPLEKNIADFFIHNEEKMDLSSKSVSKRLYVSEASLSRFAKNVVIRATENLFSAMSREDRAASKNQAVITLSGY